MLGTPLLLVWVAGIRSCMTSSRILKVLCSLPQVIRNDAQLWDVDHDPIFWWIQPRDAFPSVGVFTIPEPIPDPFADIKLIVEIAGATLAAPNDGGVGLPFARWCFYISPL